MITPAMTLVLCGSVYVAHPTILRKWFWNTDARNRPLSPEHYALYMRGLGLAAIVTGILWHFTMPA